MDNRLYFIFGDLIANVTAGGAVALLAWLLVDIEWNPYLSMVIMMPLGMILATLVAFPFVPFFGAIELLVPAMITGMVSGMTSGMWIAMAPVNLLQSLIIGSSAGFLTILFIWFLNSRTRGTLILEQN